MSYVFVAYIFFINQITAFRVIKVNGECNIYFCLLAHCDNGTSIQYDINTDRNRNDVMLVAVLNTNSLFVL